MFHTHRETYHSNSVPFSLPPISPNLYAFFGCFSSTNRIFRTALCPDFPNRNYFLPPFAISIPVYFLMPLLLFNKFIYFLTISTNSRGLPLRSNLRRLRFVLPLSAAHTVPMQSAVCLQFALKYPCNYSQIAARLIPKQSHLPLQSTLFLPSVLFTLTFLSVCSKILQ